MAIEDAVVFGQLFSHLSSEDQILPFLNAYEEIRKERTESVLEREISNTEMVTLPPGSAKDARDASCRQARNEWDEGLLKAEFEGLFDLFGYDAYDAAEVRLLNSNRSSSEGVGAEYAYGFVGMVGGLGEIPKQGGKE